MRNFLILMIFALLTSCRMKLDDNFFEVQEDTVSGFVEYDSYGFDKDPLITSFYVRGDFIDVYYLNAPAKSFHIEDIDAKKNRVHYTLSGGSDFYRNYIAIFSDGDIFTGGPDLGLNRYFTSNAKTLSSPPDAKHVSYQQIEDYEKNGEVRGRVKSTHTRSYSLENKFGKDVLELEEGQVVYEYDPMGNITKHLIFLCDEKSGKKQLIWEESFVYGDNRLISYEKREGTPPYSTSVVKTTYQYNDSGLLIKEHKTDNYESYSDYSFKRSWTYVTEYSYTDDSTLTEINFFDSRGNLEHKTTFTKDSDGNIVETRYDRNGEKAWVSQYDAKGFLQSGMKPYGTGIYNPLNTKVSYDLNNIIILRNNPYRITYPSSAEVRDMKRIYNKSCDLLAEDIKWEDVWHNNNTYYAEEHKTYYYIHDSNGNWIKKKIISNMDDPDGVFWKSSITIEERDIEYY